MYKNLKKPIEQKILLHIQLQFAYKFYKNILTKYPKEKLFYQISKGDYDKKFSTMGRGKFAKIGNNMKKHYFIMMKKIQDYCKYLKRRKIDIKYHITFFFNKNTLLYIIK